MPTLNAPLGRGKRSQSPGLPSIKGSVLKVEMDCD
jgi:hypothetical protein